eukprot:CAMPEP_0180749684 /NCGR_PEP_ID=MMETSP1038_2-20121128/30722_1 /TAXON_ID=632150 /ORGANISM="Azadinium spinosum, Strain 3D9" /LENGTH=298 /DNA_ID=CAMNT_0022783403 /DNA_START=225 /DNA_END=1117 /DNA_ORIENTATION=+
MGRETAIQNLDGEAATVALPARPGRLNPLHSVALRLASSTLLVGLQVSQQVLQRHACTFMDVTASIFSAAASSASSSRMRRRRFAARSSSAKDSYLELFCRTASFRGSPALANCTAMCFPYSASIFFSDIASCSFATLRLALAAVVSIMGAVTAATLRAGACRSTSESAAAGLITERRASAPQPGFSAMAQSSDRLFAIGLFGSGAGMPPGKRDSMCCIAELGSLDAFALAAAMTQEGVPRLVLLAAADPLLVLLVAVDPAVLAVPTAVATSLLAGLANVAPACTAAGGGATGAALDA